VKIVFLSKRKPQGRDLIKRPYGRFFHIPRLLSEKGHEIHLVVLGYKNEPALQEYIDGIHWYSESLIPYGPLPYFRTLTRLISRIQPDCIVGCSDTWYGILAAYLGSRYGIRSGIDAYDNYESYIPWLLPLHWAWRWAIEKSTVITAAGPHLGSMMARFRKDRVYHFVPMSADIQFKPMDRCYCRRKLGLPEGKKLIGYCGSLYRSRGIENLFNAFEILNKQDPQIMLVASGRKEKGLEIPSGVKYLGYLPDDILPFFVNSLDVMVVMNQLSSFGNYSYPVKLYEAMQCRIPVVASETPPARWILNNTPRFLSNPDRINDLVLKIQENLSLGRYDYDCLNTWEQSCDNFESALRSVLIKAR
jgi:glycosyltransferase involved in cell wall biosynthesis